MSARFESIESLHAAICSRPENIVEFTRETIDALQTDGQVLDAVVHIAELEALERASRLEAEAAGSGVPPDAPLFGIPLAHKDLYMRAGWPCTGGSATLAEHRADRTAFALEQLDRAGALDCGRLDSVELGLGTTGHNEYCGTPRNPWDPDYICGGSSSGSSATVAAGIVPAALGSDTGGSVRLPAAACGLVGIKPTHGLVGRSGVIALSPTLDTVGPLTRTVRDGAIVLQALIGEDRNDPASIRVDGPNYLSDIESGMEGLRIGWPSNHFFADVDAEVADGVKHVFDLGGRLGAKLSEVAVPDIETANAMTMLLVAVEGMALHEQTILSDHERFGPQSLQRLLVGAFVSARDYHYALANREALARRVLSETFESVDIVVTPVWPYPLPTIAQSDVGARPEAADLVFRSGHNTRPVNYLGFPAINLPTGFDRNGLPTSLQLIGRPWSESLLLRAARALERELDFWSKRPDLSRIR